MSRTKPSPTDTAMLKYQCPKCGALPLTWCSYPTGRLSFYLHSGRFHLVLDEYERPARS